jgi:hypothetical protein
MWCVGAMVGVVAAKVLATLAALQRRIERLRALAMQASSNSMPSAASSFTVTDVSELLKKWRTIVARTAPFVKEVTQTTGGK